MPDSTKKEDTKKSVQEANFDNARETAQINHDKSVKQNASDGNEGVEVRELKAIEVINPVLNPSTGKLEDDTRTLKQSHEEALGLDTKAEAGGIADTKNEDRAAGKTSTGVQPGTASGTK